MAREPRTDHFIVCGANNLARRLVAELVGHYEVSVVVIVPTEDSTHPDELARIIDELAGLVGDPNVLRHRTITDEALKEADTDTAQGIAFIGTDDQANIHAALRAKAINAGLRFVIRIYNRRLGEHIERLIVNCTAMSASSTAAPAFVNAALGRPPSVEAGGRALHVTTGEDIDPEKTLCVAAELPDMGTLPKTDVDTPSELAMLPVVTGAAVAWIERDILGKQPVIRRRAMVEYFDDVPSISVNKLSRARWRLIDAVRFFTSAQLRIILVGAVVMVGVSFVGILYARPFGWSVYETLLDVAGSAVPDVFGQPSATGGVWQRVFQVAITFSGILLIPVITAIFLEGTASRRAARARQPSAGVRGHAVVVGLGNVGTRVAIELAVKGVPVVCVERDPAARGIGAVSGYDIPVVVGDMPLADALNLAHAERSRVVLALTGDDVTNLEAVLEAGAIQPGVRVVVRLFDDDFANHVREEFGANSASHSVSSLSAPAFAAALMGREVLGTLEVRIPLEVHEDDEAVETPSARRRFLMISEVTATQDSGFPGRRLGEVDKQGAIRVVGLRRHNETEYHWNVADRRRPLKAGDSIIVATTRTGLAQLHSSDG